MVFLTTHIKLSPTYTLLATSLQFTNTCFFSSKSTNSNVTVPTLNTNFWKKPAFQYTSAEEGYFPKEGVYIYGLRNGTIGDLKDELKKNVIYLGETHYNFPGNPIGTKTFTNYKKRSMGKPILL